MKHQHISVDMMNMILTACSYLALAGAVWIFLRLIQACFLLPRQLKKQNNIEKLLEEKVESYEKYVLECEEKEKTEMLDQIDDEKKNLEMSEKWKERRECLNMLKHELKRVQNNENDDPAYWDKLLDEELKKYADNSKITEDGEENSENYTNKKEDMNSEKKKELIEMNTELKKDK